MPPSEQLNFWKQGLAEVPPWVWDRPETRELILADNTLESLSGGVARLTRLRMLDLGHNRLTALPPELGSLADCLTGFLYLHDNRLRTLPDSLARLTRLRYLNLSGNPLADGRLPEEAVCGMTGLVELRATDCGLTALPAGLASLGRRLRELHLRNNRLDTLDAGTLAALAELQVLDLRGNPLAELPWDAMAALPQIRKIDLRWTAPDLQPPEGWAEAMEARRCLVYR